METTESLNKWLDLNHQTYTNMYKNVYSDKQVVKKIAQYELTEYESVALRYYTDFGYEQLNQVLRNPRAYSDVKYAYLQDVKTILNQALQKLSYFEGYISRYVTLPDIEKYEAGEIITYSEFISTTKSDKILPVAQFAEHKLVMKSCSGREIAWISEQPDEQEVLFMTDSSFLVIDKQQEDDFIKVIMEEVP